MPIPAVLHRKRGNPNWGKPFRSGPVLATEFELETHRLRLAPDGYISSRELLIWCERNKNRVYIPEWLLDEWRITVDPIFTTA